ncbi:hypothetical protein LJR220_003406 [Bradyrhizobium sp. LjRoot220]|uniref:hypothetical protein n=1 Tax=Bradyrhizobium sp. LjRoot220 TaxID=3342284 RepID=UPI003ECD9A73
MSKLVKVSSPTGKQNYYVNGAQVNYYQPTDDGGTTIHFSNGTQTLKVKSSIDEIMAQLP